VTRTYAICQRSGGTAWVPALAALGRDDRRRIAGLA
jgi:hypothetical protein